MPISEDKLLREVTSEYTKTLIRINNDITNQTLVNTISSTSVVNDGVFCNNCLSNFITNPSEISGNTEYMNYKRDKIDKLRGASLYGSCKTNNDCDGSDLCTTSNKCMKQNKNAICYDSCTTVVNIIMDNSLSFISSTDIKVLSPDDIASVVNNVTENIKQEYKGVDLDKRAVKQLVDSINSIDLRTELLTSQVATQIQIASIKGPVKMTNVHMSMVANVIMSAVVKNITVVDMLTDIINNAMVSVKSNVDKSMTNEVTQAFKDLKNFLIYTFITIVVIIVSIVYLLLVKASKSKSNK